MFEMKVRPLRALYTKHLNQEQPENAWTQDLKELFTALKADITCSLVMTRLIAQGLASLYGMEQ